MQNTTHIDKKAMRKVLTEERSALGKEFRALASSRICARLRDLSCWRYADTVLLYMPIKSEVDILPLLNEALAGGKTVGLPRCGEKGVMRFHLVTDLSELSPGSYGIPEPAKDAPELREELSSPRALAIVPGLAFDLSGYRLGYGGGFYDRFLGAFAGISVGVCYADLIKNELPRGVYDRKVQLIVTERKVILP